MNTTTVNALCERLDRVDTLNSDMLADMADAVTGLFPNAPAHPEVIAEPTEAVLHLIDRCLPGWNIHLTGQASEPDGHWRCSLRRSDAHDDDEVVGTGSGPTVPLALSRAFMDAVAKMSK